MSHEIQANVVCVLHDVVRGRCRMFARRALVEVDAR
jgi:hypothetical protein